MIFRYRQLDQKLKTDRKRFVGWLNRVMSHAGFSLLLVFTAFCNPKSVGLAELADVPTVLVSAPSMVPTPETHVPVLAFYYIWFDTRSWNRAKTDYPLLGRYSSDNADVMRQHVEWAKEAGSMASS